ncbi:MAG: MlaD family protein [Acidobacteriota bacterium]
MALPPPIEETAPTRSAERHEPAKRRTFWLVVLALSLVAVAAAWRAYQERHRFLLHVSFHEVDGLRPGAEVRLSGVKVGAVQRIELTGVQKVVQWDTPQVQVTLGIDRRLTGLSAAQLIHRDAVAVLKRDGTLADRIVDISPGSATAPLVAEGDFITGQIEGDSRTIALRSAQANANLEVMRERLLAVQQRLERGEGTLGAVLKRRELTDQIAQFQTELTGLQQALQSGSGFALVARRRLQPRVTALQMAANRLRADIKGGRGTAGQFLANSTWRERVTALQARYDRLAARLTTLQQTAQRSTLGRLVKEEAFRQQFQTTRAHLTRIQKQLEQQEGSAGKFLHDGRLRRELAELTAELTKTVYDVRQSPFKYIRLRF